eukprot:TRINITY_DN711_c0_g1_i1.p1 TRINITY_DN711_c0_g1~~TRINITY_DN711_c0_g1_i1.p1  ORF type:complete len:150 (-),score=20.69 TRINITY_DN711_c0_g1_i1:429-878(-)
MDLDTNVVRRGEDLLRFDCYMYCSPAMISQADFDALDLPTTYDVYVQKMRLGELSRFDGQCEKNPSLSRQGDQLFFIGANVECCSGSALFDSSTNTAFGIMQGEGMVDVPGSPSRLVNFVFPYSHPKFGVRYRENNAAVVNQVRADDQL